MYNPYDFTAPGCVFFIGIIAAVFFGVVFIMWGMGYVVHYQIIFILVFIASVLMVKFLKLPGDIEVWVFYFASLPFFTLIFAYIYMLIGGKYGVEEQKGRYVLLAAENFGFWGTLSFCVVYLIFIIYVPYFISRAIWANKW